MRQPSLIYARNLMILQHPLIVVLAQLLRPDGRILGYRRCSVEFVSFYRFVGWSHMVDKLILTHFPAVGLVFFTN